MKQADEDELTPEERLALRQQESAAALAALEQELCGWRELYLASGKMGEACKYVENQRESLRVFLQDGRVPIHNNACEVAIRPVAVGRKNWLFAGSVRGGRAAATVYTLAQSCKKAGVDPLVYLADVLKRVATHPAARVEELIPANWKRLFAQDLATLACRWSPRGSIHRLRRAPDANATSALLDRLLHHAYVLQCGPKSWRMQRKGLQAAGP